MVLAWRLTRDGSQSVAGAGTAGAYRASLPPCRLRASPWGLSLGITWASSQHGGLREGPA